VSARSGWANGVLGDNRTSPEGLAVSEVLDGQIERVTPRSDRQRRREFPRRPSRRQSAERCRDHIHGECRARVVFWPSPRFAFACTVNSCGPSVGRSQTAVTNALSSGFRSILNPGASKVILSGDSTPPTKSRFENGRPNTQVSRDRSELSASDVGSSPASGDRCQKQRRVPVYVLKPLRRTGSSTSCHGSPRAWWTHAG